MNCQWQMGLLMMRPCDQPAVGSCGLCGRALCSAHAVPGPSGPACPQCAASHEGYDETEDTELAESRNAYYRPYGAVLGYGQAGFFSPLDSRAMNRPVAPVRHGQSDDYDAMET